MNAGRDKLEKAWRETFTACETARKEYGRAAGARRKAFWAREADEGTDGGYRKACGLARRARKVWRDAYLEAGKAYTALYDYDNKHKETE